MYARVANDKKLWSSRIYRLVGLIMQRCQGVNEFYSNALNDYDVVLGAKWLKAIGPLGWDFSKMLLSFSHDN